MTPTPPTASNNQDGIIYDMNEHHSDEYTGDGVGSNEVPKTKQTKKVDDYRNTVFYVSLGFGLLVTSLLSTIYEDPFTSDFSMVYTGFCAMTDLTTQSIKNKDIFESVTKATFHTIINIIITKTTTKLLNPIALDIIKYGSLIKYGTGFLIISGLSYLAFIAADYILDEEKYTKENAQ